jgi:hypothetical protein
MLLAFFSEMEINISLGSLTHLLTQFVVAAFLRAFFGHLFARLSGPIIYRWVINYITCFSKVSGECSVIITSQLHLVPMMY